MYVHEAGAPHLIDPARLLKSAHRLYGDDMERLWGEVLPVPEENLTTLTGGELIDGLRVLYTPGHASHHVSYVDVETGDAYVGDVAGVRIPPAAEVWAPTPPPDIDVELWDASIAAIADLEPERLLLAHFGAVADPPAHLEAMRAELHRLAETARAGDRVELPRRARRADRRPARRRARADPPGDAARAGLAGHGALLGEARLRPLLRARGRVRNARSKGSRAVPP